MDQKFDLASFNPKVTYNNGAVAYEEASRAYWAVFGERSADRLGLQPGQTVLDVACGSGSSALPAAERVGPQGRVVAVDLAPMMLEIARHKAHERGLQNIQFHQADMTELDYPEGQFDAVVCVLGIVFCPDMRKAIVELWRMLRPGGRLMITVLGPRFFKPLYKVWKTAMLTEQPDLKIKLPWERLNQSFAVCQLMTRAGIPNAEVALEENYLELSSPDDWWNIVMGTGMRRFVSELNPPAARRVRQDNLEWALEHHITGLELDVIYALADKNG
jgi:SAM-dependent methyltransferase